MPCENLKELEYFITVIACNKQNKMCYCKTLEHNIEQMDKRQTKALTAIQLSNDVRVCCLKLHTLNSCHEYGN